MLPPFAGGYAVDVKRILSMVVALSVVVLPLSTAFVAGPVAAVPLVRGDTSDFSFESFDADYTLTRDAEGYAEMRVVETLVAVFPDFDQNRGILRDIPSYYGEVPLNLSDFAVHDENGNPWHPEQALSRLETLEGYTCNAAFAAGWEGWYGRIAPGFAAEFTVWDRNPSLEAANPIRALKP